MATPPGQDPQPPQQPDAPPVIVSISGPTDPVGEPVRPGRPEPRRLVAAGLAALAMLLAVLGCLFPFFSIEHRFSFDRSDAVVVVFVQSAWDTKVLQPNDPPFSAPSTPVGIPVLIAAAILLAAVIVSARASRLRRPGALDRWLTTIAAVFLTGVVATAATLSFGRTMGESIETTTTLGAGMWALFAAVVAAAGAAVMSHRVQDDEVPVSGDPSLADMPTPKHGISVAVLPPDPQPEKPDYSAFAPPPDPGAKERD
ncbi:hypothetical protein NQK81_19420 [Amycolatopsis roodepoortensis]|uniref:hypothetical protein n=1 Tax=Amycolatopsis roodepoortensis TaxID=700274 RepID=UPI00214B819E|nr:hypothetical protein [Amycolatopsis roodepoortensis]UUV35521.1 hypothetical protein NQK81_19420 [Amycolatopsis roodepoortensis]